MNSKGFVISLDAIIALMVFFIIFTLSTTYLEQVKFDAKNSLILKENAMDSLTVLEKNGALETSVKTNNVKLLRRFANKLPNNLCIDLGIYSESDLTKTIMSVLKPGCKKNFINSATISRSFVVRDDFETDLYLARIIVWQKVAT